MRSRAAGGSPNVAARAAISCDHRSGRAEHPADRREAFALEERAPAAVGGDHEVFDELPWRWLVVSRAEIGERVAFENRLGLRGSARSAAPRCSRSARIAWATRSWTRSCSSMLGHGARPARAPARFRRARRATLSYARAWRGCARRPAGDPEPWTVPSGPTIISVTIARAILPSLQGREVGGQPLGQHRENLARRVNRRGVGPGVLVERRAPLHRGVHVGDGHEDLHRATRQGLGHRELVEIAGIVVVDRGPGGARAGRRTGLLDSIGACATARVSARAAGEKSGWRPRWSMTRWAIALRCWFMAGLRLPRLGHGLTAARSGRPGSFRVEGDLLRGGRGCARHVDGFCSCPRTRSARPCSCRRRRRGRSRGNRVSIESIGRRARRVRAVRQGQGERADDPRGQVRRVGPRRLAEVERHGVVRAPRLVRRRHPGVQVAVRVLRRDRGGPRIGRGVRHRQADEERHFGDRRPRRGWRSSACSSPRPWRRTAARDRRATTRSVNP